ncbi:hypothetical protein I4U23_016835 [Adineta vaga]|nr:hypothetical protein I4U23_016835 [Adineta vaga]
MAMANNTKQCFKCQKYKRIIIPCQGCSKEFCQTDFNEHQQLLNEELNFIINDYDQFRHTINDQKPNPPNHSLIKRIEQWETNSIRTIRQTAEKCRQSVLEHSETSFREIEQKLSELSEQIKEIQRENEFNEIDLKDLRRKLNKMNEELNNPSNISIEEHCQGFIKEISIVLRKEVMEGASCFEDAVYFTSYYTIKAGLHQLNSENQTTNLTLVENMNLLAIGWGSTNSTPIATALQQVTIQENVLFVFHSYVNLIFYSGDMGGPLMIYSNKSEQYELVGITSYRNKCIAEGVFTRVAPFASWI